METLYHYCSNSTFCSVINNRSIWLSSLSLSNDTKEGKLVAEIMLQLAQQDGLSSEDIKRLYEQVDNLLNIAEGLGFCLSEEGDLLSQWRGYADDANGISIGFSKEYLEKLSIHQRAYVSKGVPGYTLNKVEYENHNQQNLIKPIYLQIKKLIDEGAYKNPFGTILNIRTTDEQKEDEKKIRAAFSQLSFKLLELLFKLFLLKNPAFKEEREWRLLSYVVKSGNDNCMFRAARNKLIPYRQYDLLKLDTDAINDIIIGPKNITPEYVIQQMMEQNKFTNFNIKRSEASYR